MFAEKIKQLRKEKKLTQQQLADKLFVEQTTVSSWERGKAFPDTLRLQSIADFFAVGIDELLGRGANQSINTGDITDNNGIIGRGNVINGSVRSEDASGLASELMKVFNNLPVKSQIKVMQFAYELEEQD